MRSNPNKPPSHPSLIPRPFPGARAPHQPHQALPNTLKIGATQHLVFACSEEGPINKIKKLTKF